MHHVKPSDIEILAEDEALSRIFNPHRDRETERQHWPHSRRNQRSIRRAAIAAKRSFLDG